MSSDMMDDADFEDFDEHILNGNSGSNATMFFPYDHPYWEKMENRRRMALESKQNMSPLPTSTVASIPDIYELSQSKSSSFTSIFVILGLIAVLGVLCNILVCYIYRCRSRRATSNFFVIFFAIFDIVGCLIGVPAEILALALPYTFDIVALCKLIMFIKTMSVCALCFTLMCVAYYCYQKVCRPTNEFGVKKARIYSIVALVCALFVSSPTFAVFGVKIVVVSRYDLQGESCGVDAIVDRWVVILYYVCVVFSFTVCLSVMSIFYGLIGAKIWRERQAEERGEKPTLKKREFPKKHRFVRDETSSSSTNNYNDEIGRLHSHYHSDPVRVPLKSSSSAIVKSNSLQASSPPPISAIVQLHVKTTRQALIFMTISIAFIIVMLPLIVVNILCAATNVFDHFSSDATEIVFNLCIRSYLLNYLVKPIMYLLFNINFRREVKLLFMKMWAVCTRSSAAPSASQPLKRSFTMNTRRSTSSTPIYRPPYSPS